MLGTITIAPTNLIYRTYKNNDLQPILHVRQLTEILAGEGSMLVKIVLLTPDEAQVYSLDQIILLDTCPSSCQE
jgi:hypothetical protein